MAYDACVMQDVTVLLFLTIMHGQKTFKLHHGPIFTGNR